LFFTLKHTAVRLNILSVIPYITMNYKFLYFSEIGLNFEAILKVAQIRPEMTFFRKIPSQIPN